jgi:hypothetical protein
MVLLLAVVAMPALLKFFSWSGTQLGGVSGAGSAFLGAAGAMALNGAARNNAVQRAHQQEASGPGSVTTRSSPPGAGTAAPSGAAQHDAGAAATSGVVRAAGTVGAAASAGSAATKAAANAITGKPDQGGPS